MTFKEVKEKFESERQTEDGYKTMCAATTIINQVGEEFLGLNGGELLELKVKLSGYKYNLSDYIHEMNRISKALELKIKNIRAEKWDEVTEEIKAKKGVVKNKEQITNALEIKTKDDKYRQILYETMYYKYKLKVDAIDDVLMAMTQRIKQLTEEESQHKY